MSEIGSQSNPNPSPPPGNRSNPLRIGRRRFLLAAGSTGALVGGWFIARRWTGLEDPSQTHLIPPFEVPAPTAGQHYVRCVVLGDTGTGQSGQRKVARAIEQRFQHERGDFLVLLGDNFYPRGVESADDPQWQDKVVAPYARLRVPIHAILGNHDHHGSCQAQIARNAVDPLWIMPYRYYRLSRAISDASTVDFFALDTYTLFDDDDPDDEQLNWLEEELKRSTARWKVVLGHHPVYSHSGHGTEHMRQLVEPILAANRVDMYLCGHDHCLQVIEPKNGVLYVVSGAGSADDNAVPVRWESDSLYAATRGGFVALRIGEHNLVVEMVRLHGETQFAWTLHKRA